MSSENTVVSLGIRFGFAVERKGETRPLIHQVHGSRAVALESLAEGSTPVEADAIFTRRQSPIWISTADCLPVILVSHDLQGPVAAIHAGWRGAMRGVIRQTIETAPFDGPLKVIFGPSLHPCCFEVKKDFVTEFSDERGDISRYLTERDGKMFFDLIAFVGEQEFKGLPEINFSNHHSRCTYCSRPELPSYRRNRGTDPRIRTWVERDRSIVKFTS